MSRPPTRRQVPVGLLVTSHLRPPRAATPAPTPDWPRPARLRTGFALAAVCLLWLAGLALTVFGLRPVPQGVTEAAYVPPPAAPVEPDPEPLPLEDPEPGPLTLGEARPLGGELRSLLADHTGSSPSDDTLPPGPMPCDRFGTQVDFVRSPALAFRQAARDQKLVMVLHLAGNFDDPGFT